MQNDALSMVIFIKVSKVNDRNDIIFNPTYLSKILFI